ncbi:MAG: DNA repair protein RecN [Acidobacteria bacterium]|nr:DNA repair protein RecN [Acidobacteriota bacterium]
MLRFLSVRHLAVIDRLEVEFESGLNLLTGETGAGKSVLVEAIDLLVGGRASADLVRTGEDTATVQAVFERPDGRELIVRREVSSQGRSRAFIDDALATSAALKELGQQFVDLHGQHEHQTLLDPAEHLGYLDAFLGRPDLTAAAATTFAAWRQASSALDRSRLDDREKRARTDVAAFQLQEIDRAAPKASEDDDLSAEQVMLANADRLARLSAEAYSALYEGESAALSSLALVWKRLADLAAYDPRFAKYLDERAALKSSLEDLAFFLRSYASDLDTSPDRLQAVEDRLAALERLKRKYGPTLDDVLRRREALADELTALGAGEGRVAELEANATAAAAAFRTAAGSFSAARREAAVALGSALERALADLAMPQSRVHVRVSTVDREDHWAETGMDKVELFLSANPGEEPRPLARIASGGELSRIMLALRVLVDSSPGGRTLVFDEVDAGIGGAAADAVGARLQALGERHQVLCITHLPQIAARAGTHFQIAKQVRHGRTTTTVTRLDRQGRELEIARMIAGAEVSPRLLSSARELIAARGESEDKSKAKVDRAKAKGQKRGA